VDPQSEEPKRMKCDRLPPESEGPPESHRTTKITTYIRDSHNTKGYDCEIHNKRIKVR
jgi:hypothetical protein